jgi:hypothetical protein
MYVNLLTVLIATMIGAGARYLVAAHALHVTGATGSANGTPVVAHDLAGFPVNFRDLSGCQFTKK